MPPDPNAADIVSAGAAVISAIGGAFAALAAFRSASHAKQSAMHVSDAERRLVMRQLVGTVNAVLADIALADVLSASYLAELAAYETFIHSPDHSSGTEIRARLETDLDALNSLRPELEKIKGDHHFLASASLSDLSARLSVLESYASKARVFCEDVGRHLSEFVRRNQPFRDRVANPLPPREA